MACFISYLNRCSIPYLQASVQWLAIHVDSCELCSRLAELYSVNVVIRYIVVFIFEWDVPLRHKSYCQGAKGKELASPRS